MASAILTSRNDHMSKLTNSNLNFMRLQNPNFSHFFVGNNSRDAIWKPHQRLPSSTSPQAAFIRSYVSPINSVPANSCGYRYITFRLNSYTRTELKVLKKRLVSDLQRVRILRQRVCSSTMLKLNYHQPQLELPAAPEAFFGVKEPQKRAVGQKRANPLPPVRDTKKQCGRMTVAQRRKMMMRQCGQILGKLMKHKHGWVFNTPVDAAALKLYDYHKIITNPMDLRTIKSKLAKNEYQSPLEFASDVRLTFQNAMVYNGKGSAVFAMAESLLLLFEELFDPPNQKRVVNRVKKQNHVAVAVEVESPPVVRVSNKPEMTSEEKSELAASLLNLQLGHDGMNQLVYILKKGVLGLEHQGDEIDIDLEVLDNDTLWELHGFISRARKECATNLINSVQADHYAGNEQLVEINQSSGEEFIDIGDEMQSTVFPPVVIEKDTVNVSSSESSSESDSSTSDSGSGNSYNEQEVNLTLKVDS